MSLQLDSPPDSPTPRPNPRRSRRRRLALALAVAAAVAVAPGVATLAGFAARDVNRDNVIETGRLGLGFGRDERYVEVRNMKPGDTYTTSVDVVNDASLDANYTLDVQNVMSTRIPGLDDVLVLTVSNADGTIASSGRPSELLALPSSLRTGEREEFLVTVHWPENADSIDNAYQGSDVRWEWVVDATQSGDPAPGGLGIDGVAGDLSIAVPYDPTNTAITVVRPDSTRFEVTNSSTAPQTFHFESDTTIEVWNGSGEWIITILFPGWHDGHEVALAPGETASFIANAWEPDAELRIVPAT